MDGTDEEVEAAFDVSVPADARCIPVVRRSVCRWMLRRHLDEARALVEFVTSELVAEGVTYAIEDIELHVEEIDGGMVRIEVRGPMAERPQRFVTIADQARRRREALLSALCRGHDRTVELERVTLWAEVRADRGGF